MSVKLNFGKPKAEEKVEKVVEATVEYIVEDKIVMPATKFPAFNIKRLEPLNKPLESGNAIKVFDSKPQPKPQPSFTKPQTNSPSSAQLDIEDWTKGLDPSLLAEADASLKKFESSSPKSYIKDITSLEELANEFNLPEQQDSFEEAGLLAIDTACKNLEARIDNADEVKNQLTFIMTELQQQPLLAAKISDPNIATMVRALRTNYNMVAFAKTNNAAKTAKKKQAIAEDDTFNDSLGGDLLASLQNLF